MIPSIFDSSSPFQSTLPARGATYGDGFQRSQPYKFQSTLPARGATVAAVFASRSVVISIHAPRTGSDKTPWEVG